MADGDLAGLEVVSFEARRAAELATMLGRHGARVMRAPALREAPLGENAAALAAARRLAAGTLDAVVLLTGVGTRAWAAAVADEFPRFADLLGHATVVARGPKPVAALRDLGFTAARPVAPPFTWREVLVLIEGLGLAPGTRVALQEYGVPATRLAEAMAARGLEVVRVPVYRWALPDDPGPLRAGAEAVAAGRVDVAVFTNGAQVEHLFRVAADADALRAGLGRAVVASVGPVCSETLEAHGVAVDLEPAPPKMGPLVALIAARARAVLATKRRGGAGG
jgi:uroporphyrinogen-III synthase